MSCETIHLSFPQEIRDIIKSYIDLYNHKILMIRMHSTFNDDFITLVVDWHSDFLEKEEVCSDIWTPHTDNTYLIRPNMGCMFLEHCLTYKQWNKPSCLPSCNICNGSFSQFDEGL